MSRGRVLAHIEPAASEPTKEKAMQKRSVFISEGSQGVYFRHGHPVGEQNIPAGWYDDLGFGMFAVNLSNGPKKKPTAYWPSTKHTYRIEKPRVSKQIHWPR
jgi:hypothetical protein